MNTIMRIEKLERLLNAAGGAIKGRVKLHKLVYLCQSKGTDLGQDFHFHLYGVYSPTLEFDIEWAIDRNLIETKTGANNQIITMLREKIKKTSSKEEPGFALVKQLINEPSQVLELLSTIVFLHNQGFSNEEFVSKLKELKGHLFKYDKRSWLLAKKYFDISTNTN